MMCGVQVGELCYVLEHSCRIFPLTYLQSSEAWAPSNLTDVMPVFILSLVRFPCCSQASDLAVGSEGAEEKLA